MGVAGAGGGFSAVFMHEYLTVQNTECKRGGSELVDTPQSLYSTALPTLPPVDRRRHWSPRARTVQNSVTATESPRLWRRPDVQRPKKKKKKRRGNDLPVGGRPPPFQLFQGFAFRS